MADNTDMMINVEADVAKAIQDIQNLEKSLKATQTTINNQLNPSANTMGQKISNVGGRITAFGNTIKSKLGLEGAMAFGALGAAATNMAKQCVDAAMKSESEWTRFGALVNSNGGNWNAEEAKVKKWATSFSNQMGYAVSDTREASMALLQFGVRSSELETAMKGVAGVAARTGMTEAEASNMVISALNGRGMQLAKLTGLRIEDYKNADGQIDRERLLKDLYDQNTEAIEKHGQTTEAQIQRMNNSWGSFKKQIGDALMPVVKIVADIASAVANGFANLPTPVKQFIAALLLVGGAIGTVIGALAFLAPVFTTIGGVISALGTAFGAVSGFIGPVIASFAGVAASGSGVMGVLGVIGTTIGGLLAPFSAILIPLGAVIAAFAALYLVGASLGWWNDLGGMINKIGESLGWLAQQLAPVGEALAWVGGQVASFLGWLVRLFTDFSGATAQFNDFVNNLGTTITNGLGGIWDWLVSSASSALADLGGVLGDAFEGVMTSILDGIRGAGQSFSDAFNGLLDAGVQGAGQLIDGFIQGLTGLGAEISKYLSNLPGIISEALSNLGASVVPGGGLVEGILTLFAPLPMLIAGKIMELAPTVLPAVQAFISQIVTAFSNIGSSILNMLISIPTMIGQFFMQLPMIIQQFLMNAILTVNMYILMIRTAIVARFLTLVMNVRMIWTMIVNAIRSRLMQARLVASNLAMMLRNAIITRWNALTARVRQIFQSIVNQIRSRLANAVSSARQKAQEIYQGIKDKVSSIPQMVADEFNKIKDKVVNALNNVKTAAIGKIQELVSAVKGALGIASPGYIQRMMTYEFNSLPGIVESGTNMAAKMAATGAKAIVSAWQDNMETLTVEVADVRNISPPQVDIGSVDYTVPVDTLRDNIESLSMDMQGAMQNAMNITPPDMTWSTVSSDASVNALRENIESLSLTMGEAMDITPPSVTLEAVDYEAPVNALRENIESLSLNMRDAMNITIPQVIPDIFNPTATVNTRVDTNTPLFQGMRPETTQNIQHREGNTLIIKEINLDCNNLTQAQSKRVVWQAIQGVYEGL